MSHTYGDCALLEDQTYWQVRPQDFQNPTHFQRIKNLGFDSRDELPRFMDALSTTVDATDYDPDVMAAMLSAMDQPLGNELAAEDLETYAKDGGMRSHYLSGICFEHN